METKKLWVELLDGGGTRVWFGTAADLLRDNDGTNEAVAAIAAGTATEVKVGAFTIRKIDRTLYATVVRYWTDQVLRGADEDDFKAEAEAEAEFRNRWMDAKTGMEVYIL